MRRLTIGLAALSALMILTGFGYVVFMAIDADTPSRFRNASHSMDSTLLTGEQFSLRLPDSATRDNLPRGTVVTHRWPEDRAKQFVKRVVGVPGDTLSMANGVLVVDARRQVEPYAWHADTAIDPAPDDFRWQRKYLVKKGDSARYAPSRNNWGPIVVPAGQYFVLGDNRDNSLDSRYWGFVPSHDITGIVRRVFTSYDTLGRTRWWRFGHRVH